MKAITIKQPWASLIVEGYKTIENRTWNTSYRGDLLIHAGKTDDNINLETMPKEVADAIKQIPKPYIHSAILGKATLYDIQKSYDDFEDADNPFGEDNCFHWKLKSIQKFNSPIEDVKGKLSIWEFNDERLNV